MNQFSFVICAAQLTQYKPHSQTEYAVWNQMCLSVNAQIRFQLVFIQYMVHVTSYKMWNVIYNCVFFLLILSS